MPVKLIRAWEARAAKLKHCSNPRIKVGLGRYEQNGLFDETVRDNLDMVCANGGQVQFVSGPAGISQPSTMGHQQTQQPMRNPSITIRLGARIPDSRSRRDMAIATSKVQIKHFAVPRHFERRVFCPLHSRQSQSHSAQRPSRGQSAVGSRSVGRRPRRRCVNPRPSGERKDQFSWVKGIREQSVKVELFGE